MATGVFSFPPPVNEVSARLVAGGVALLALATVASHERWLLVPLAYGFIARVLAGPRFSPLGQLVTRVITPRLPVPPKYVAGPPKRFAQSLGALMSTAALVLAFGFGLTNVAYVLIGALAVFATLEAAFALCVGCRIFALLIAAHVVPVEVCVECANIQLRSPAQPERAHAGLG